MLITVIIENLKIRKYTILKKTLVLSVICSKCKNEDEQTLKDEKSIEILNFFGFVENIKLL